MTAADWIDLARQYHAIKYANGSSLWASTALAIENFRLLLNLAGCKEVVDVVVYNNFFDEPASMEQERLFLLVTCQFSLFNQTLN